jgi:hypothetical protein
MSLRGKDFRCELDPDLHEKLRVMAAFDDREVSRLGARLLENAIAGAWHEFSVLRDRLERVGNLRKEPKR